MKHLLLLTSALCLGFSLFPAAAQAQDEAAAGDSLLSFGIGYTDIFDDEDAVDFRVEYRPYRPLLINALRPWIAGEITSDFSTWAGGGLLYDWNVQDNIYVTPSFGAGLYAQGGSDLDLGHVVEFRSQLEVAYEFETRQRLGLSLSHMSNMGLDDHNPGTEALNLYWHVPF
ncbi:MAG: acyloxyacyl hydrolase [Alphaproteobacteria bacterium]|nr:acyloxyacyl hydrolase [Alphaproteobacteria bacterium]